VQEYDVPAGEIQVHRTPNLVSSSLAAFGGDPRLQSDLSERLVAARGALKKCGLSRFQRKIAAALKACGVKPARRSKHDPGNEEWSPEDIHDLVRAFENRVRKRILKPPGKTLRDLVAAECERVTIRWVRTYREACEFERRSGAVTEPPET